MIKAKYRSVEIEVSDSEPVYVFRIRNIPFSGMGILVKEDSAILNHLKAGDQLNFKYNPIEASDLPEYRKTGINFITKYDQSRLNGHYLVNFSVIEE